MLAVISNQHLTKNNIRRKAGKCKTAHSSPPDYETRNIVSTSDGVSCAENDELTKNGKSPADKKSRLRVKCPGFNFARGSESPFVHCTQPYRRAGNPPSSGTREHSSRYHGFACQPLRGLVIFILVTKA